MYKEMSSTLNYCQIKLLNIRKVLVDMDIWEEVEKRVLEIESTEG